MSSPSPSNRNVEWAVETFRPLLKDLKLQYVDENPTVVYAMSYRPLIIKGMGRCIIGVQKQRITDGQKGYCTFIHDKARDLFILSIVIDESLFIDDSDNLRMQRKALGVHEFLHCVAIMMSISPLGTSPNPLIERLAEVLHTKLVETSSEDFSQLLNALGTMTKDTDFSSIGISNDKHFRTGFEDFPDDYAELYLNFLFSYKVLLEMLDRIDKFDLRRCISEKDEKGIIRHLQDLTNLIVTEKALDLKFVIQRIIHYLPRMIEYLK